MGGSASPRSGLARFDAGLSATYKFLEPIDFIGLRLTGRFAASIDSITLHWLTDNRDIENVTYDDGLIKLATIDRAKLPDLKPANSILGSLRPEIAREWGLREDVRVVIGSPDIHSAAIGSGAVRDYETHLYIGTSSWLTCHIPFKKTDLLHGLASLPSAIPGRYLLTDAQECAGDCLQNLRDNILFHQDELSLGAKPSNGYQLFDQIAARTPAGSDKLIFTPWLYGERAPVDDRFVRGGFFNQSLKTTREHMVRALREGGPARAGGAEPGRPGGPGADLLQPPVRGTGGANGGYQAGRAWGAARYLPRGSEASEAAWPSP